VEQVPQTKYAKTPDGIHVAYQVIGTGPVDLVLINGWMAHVEAQWEEWRFAHVLRRLAAFSRLIVFDKRGVGMSDPAPIADLPSIEQWAQDVIAVMDAASSERAVIFGTGSGGAMAVVFAATYPERTSALVLANAFSRFTRAPDYAEGAPPGPVDGYLRRQDELWGTGALYQVLLPSTAGDDHLREWLGRYERLSASPGTAAAMARMLFGVDVRPALPIIAVPTLVLHSRDLEPVRVGHGRYLAAHIPGARYVELPGIDAELFGPDSDPILDEVEEFVTGVRRGPDANRVLATVLFTDVVGSTETSALLGDKRWLELLNAHDTAVRRQLERFRGKEVKNTGDGILATFDGPARAIHCATSIRDAVRGLGLAVRAGLHTGEIELRHEDIAGIAVHIAQRVCALSESGEILVSETVPGLVAGSGIEFEDRGKHQLKGVPGRWGVLRVADS